MISLLVPTRNRIEGLKTFLDSAKNTCHNINNFEVLIRIDEDDINTISFIKEYKSLNIRTVIGKRLGYGHYGEMVKELLLISKGFFYYLLSDDAEMTSKNWDLSILSTTNMFKDNIFALRVNHNHSNVSELNIFPIVTRRWYEIIGNFALTDGQIDFSCRLISMNLNREIYLPTIRINHNHPDYKTGTINGKKDSTAIEGILALSNKKISQGIDARSFQGYKLNLKALNNLSDTINKNKSILRNGLHTIKLFRDMWFPYNNRLNMILYLSYLKWRILK